MGLLSKIFKPIKKVVKKVGKFIKRVAKKVGGAFGKLGILGHIGMMFLMPYAQSFWGTLGKFGTKLVQGTSLAGKGFGHVMRGIYHAGKAVGTVYRGVTEAVEGSLKWLSNKVGLTDIADPFSGLKTVVDDAGRWGSEGWKGDKVSVIKKGDYLAGKKIEGFTGETTTTKDSIYDIGDETNYDSDIATGKKQIDPQTIDTTTVDVDLEDPSLLSRGKEILSEGFEKSKQQFKDTLVDAPSMVVRDALKTGVQKSIMGTPQTSYGGSVSFNVAGTGDILSYNDIANDPNNLYSKGLSYGSPFMQPFTQKINDGWDEYMESLAPSSTFDYATVTGR